MNRLLNKKDLAELLGITEAGVNKMIMERRVPYLKPTGKKGGPVRFDPDAIEAWLKEQTIEPVAWV